MTRPITGYRVLGFDPAFRTGCKLACLDERGNLLHIDVIYPHEPKNDKEGARKKYLNLLVNTTLTLSLLVMVLHLEKVKNLLLKQLKIFQTYTTQS